MRKSENPEMKRRPFIWQHVTFANVFFFSVSLSFSGDEPGPFLQWHGAIEKVIQHREVLRHRWGAALTFQISCSISAALRLPACHHHPTLHSHPLSERPHKWFPARSNVWGRGAVHASPVCVRWRVPGGARWQPVAHYFSRRPDPCWDVCGGTVKIASLLRRMKCGGFSFQNRRGSGS